MTGHASTSRVLTLFEPRWHGWALWKLEECELSNVGAPDDKPRFALLRPLEEGWTRRPKGSPCVSFVEGRVGQVARDA